MFFVINYFKKRIFIGIMFVVEFNLMYLYILIKLILFLLLNFRSCREEFFSNGLFRFYNFLFILVIIVLLVKFWL